jgi:hypothetical protein
MAAAIARLAERADVEIAVARWPGLDARDFAAHDNVAVAGDEALGAVLAASHLVVADAPAVQAAAARLGIPSVPPGVPALVLQRVERLLDADTADAPIRLAA